jgi:hypothetical protein
MDGDENAGQFTMTFEQKGRAAGRDGTPELADLRRYGRRMVRRFVTTARADERPTFVRIIRGYPGVDTQSALRLHARARSMRTSSSCRRRPSTTYAVRWSGWRATGSACAPPGST